MLRAALASSFALSSPASLGTNPMHFPPSMLTVYVQKGTGRAQPQPQPNAKAGGPASSDLSHALQWLMQQAAGVGAPEAGATAPPPVVEGSGDADGGAQGNVAAAEALTELQRMEQQQAQGEEPDQEHSDLPCQVLDDATSEASQGGSEEERQGQQLHLQPRQMEEAAALAGEEEEVVPGLLGRPQRMHRITMLPPFRPPSSSPTPSPEQPTLNEGSQQGLMPQGLLVQGRVSTTPEPDPQPMPPLCLPSFTSDGGLRDQDKVITTPAHPGTGGLLAPPPTPATPAPHSLILGLRSDGSLPATPPSVPSKPSGMGPRGLADFRSDGGLPEAPRRMGHMGLSSFRSDGRHEPHATGATAAAAAAATDAPPPAPSKPQRPVGLSFSTAFTSDGGLPPLGASMRGPGPAHAAAARLGDLSLPGLPHSDARVPAGLGPMRPLPAHQPVARPPGPRPYVFSFTSDGGLPPEPQPLEQGPKNVGAGEGGAPQLLQSLVGLQAACAPGQLPPLPPQLIPALVRAQLLHLLSGGKQQQQGAKGAGGQAQEQEGDAPAGVGAHGKPPKTLSPAQALQMQKQAAAEVGTMSKGQADPQMVDTLVQGLAAAEMVLLAETTLLASMGPEPAVKPGGGTAGGSASNSSGSGVSSSGDAASAGGAIVPLPALGPAVRDAPASPAQLVAAAKEMRWDVGWLLRKLAGGSPLRLLLGSSGLLPHSAVPPCPQGTIGLLASAWLQAVAQLPGGKVVIKAVRTWVHTCCACCIPGTAAGTAAAGPFASAPEAACGMCSFSGPPTAEPTHITPQAMPMHPAPSCMVPHNPWLMNTLPRPALPHVCMRAAHWLTCCPRASASTTTTSTTGTTTGPLLPSARRSHTCCARANCRSLCTALTRSCWWVVGSWAVCPCPGPYIVLLCLVHACGGWNP